MQHTDSKAEQQRLVCLDGTKPAHGAEPATDKDKKEKNDEGIETCAAPFMMINDLGLTFGQASLMNTNEKSSPNFDRWTKTRSGRARRAVRPCSAPH